MPRFPRSTLKILHTIDKIDRMCATCLPFYIAIRHCPLVEEMRNYICGGENYKRFISEKLKRAIQLNRNYKENH